MRALSIRQPFAELIPSASSGQALRGIKTDFGELSRAVEYRSRPTRIIGQRFHIYASLKRASIADSAAIWSRDLAMPSGGGGDALPRWMIELAEQVGMIEPGALALLPRGVIVGSAVIERVTQQQDEAMYRWHLADVERATRLRKPSGHPQPVWFEPF